MCGPTTKLTWLLIITIIHLMVIESRLVPRTKRRLSRKNNDFELPKEFFDETLSLQSKFRVPSTEFCKEMSLKAEAHYVVLPWWYHYCQDLHEKRVRTKKGNPHFTAIHQYILNEVQAYKKRLRAKQQKMSQLEQELLAS
ncbi:uncharacterized protein LOC126912797 [Spodoptera frugiperda]|uniref:Uncharacterized protein LOC126912797 n=1 Tax=Spodoptera frugiperda TaxID=7108 RepID=A0A9R0ECW2_SPOFR|nr:uncharacterized protein LOC126912797 [Spodoptera frugiperda]